MRLLWFAWLREKTGAAREEVETEAPTLAALVDDLRAREPRWADALADLTAIRAALDEDLAQDWNASLAGVREVAFFPPVTGG